MANNAPCKGCKDRTVEPNCHMTCDKYLEFVAGKHKEQNVRKQVETAYFLDASRKAKEHNRIY